jgi:uncharacterized protein
MTERVEPLHSGFDSLEPPMLPLSDFVVDVSSICDLYCPGCPIYHMEDKGFLGMPGKAESSVVEQTGVRINEHATAHNLDEVNVVLFGGDPYIRGGQYLRDVVGSLQRNIQDTKLNLRATTNGVRFGKDAELRDTVEELGIGTAISLDGYKPVHDTNRIHRDGSGTYEEVTTAIDLLRFEHPSVYRGLLCTLIDPHSDPVLTHRTLTSFKPPAIDYLLDHGMAGKYEPAASYEERAQAAPYGNWLTHAFNEWCSTPVTESLPRVRLFDTIIDLCNGNRSGGAMQAGGDRPWSVVAIATDGSMRNDPGYNAAYDGAANTGMNVYDHSFDDVLRYPSFVRTQIGRAGLSQACQPCPIVDICGGGFPSHRYWNPGDVPAEYVAELFNFPSVYCPDMAVLINFIKECLDLSRAEKAN